MEPRDGNLAWFAIVGKGLAFGRVCSVYVIWSLLFWERESEDEEETDRKRNRVCHNYKQDLKDSSSYYIQVSPHGIRSGFFFGVYVMVMLMLCSFAIILPIAVPICSS